MKKPILCIVSCRYAFKGKPHLPQIVMLKGREYDSEVEDVANGIPMWVVEAALEKEQIKLQNSQPVSEPAAPVIPAAGSNENENEDDFNPETATLDELKAFVKADEALDSVVDLRAAESTIRATVVAYLGD